VALRELMRRFAPLRAAALLAALWAMVPIYAIADAPPAVSEYEVKAAFLFNFAKFVEWPDSAFRHPDEPIVLGILGEDPFGASIDRMLADKTIGGHRLLVKRFRGVDTLERCHILFIGRSEEERLDRVLAKLDGAPTLTVGEGEQFAEAGGMIAFVIDHNRVRFDVDLHAAREAGLNPSSQLLKVARIVRGAPATSATEVR
jgi:YfiR/HmsC-like